MFYTVYDVYDTISIPSLTIKIKSAAGRPSVLTRLHQLSQPVGGKQLQLLELESADNKHKRGHSLYSTIYTNTFASWMCVNLTQSHYNQTELDHKTSI